MNALVYSMKASNQAAAYFFFFFFFFFNVLYHSALKTKVDKVYSCNTESMSKQDLKYALSISLH